MKKLFSQHGWLWVIPVLLALVVSADALFALQAADHRWSVFATGVAVTAAAALVGGLVGFLFGVPRTIDPSSKPADAPQYQGNTNLEQISDWLTKALVGIGLVQLGHAMPALGSLADGLKDPLGSSPASGPFGLAIAIASAALGFLYLYLWSRLRLAGELRSADQINLQIDLHEQQKTASLVVVNQQLAQGGQPPSQDQLNDAIARADDATRLLVFNQAEAIRHDNWELNKPAMERTIPIFRALIAADTENRHHRNHGSLGWALKDQQQPDLDAAKRELTQAVKTRDALGAPGWKVYEANRALCNILQLNAPGAPAPTADDIASINADLRVAMTDPFARDMIQLNQVLQAWLATHPL